ncbi:hypothetical protein SAMN04488107_0782 [Geodermatophilus saharensis]|uniref:Uncharacterized protein n=1 Tax=Geodermatophilus saharensis TaxID=1137994 RepID=A0A239AI32_9ACTN|nr:hypothetical protein [Geodermatophilus saharensis]SNR94603.1 hypothetical protein SAMN04488107_0782 [Geodermatophilus saharensis]
MTVLTTPLPATAPPSATPGARALLELACARLRALGILAAGGLPGDAGATRVALSAALLARFPAAACSYAFWTAEEESAFDAAGALTRPLLLHVNGSPVLAAVQAALAERGLAAVAGPEPLTLLVLPHAA